MEWQCVSIAFGVAGGGKGEQGAEWEMTYARLDDHLLFFVQWNRVSCRDARSHEIEILSRDQALTARPQTLPWRL